MKIVTTRRISQLFFFVLFVWFCIVSTVGDKIFQLRNWPVNWLLQLDPLVALGTILTSHTLYTGLLWALATVILTIIVGRFFCSWVCPFGSMHHFIGYLGRRKKPVAKKIDLNTYRNAQRIKYVILFVLLGMALFPSMAATLQLGLLDPIPLVTRSFNMIIVAIGDKPFNVIFPNDRFYELGWLTFGIFAGALLLNLAIPRFFCRFICPLGAFFGIINRFAIWRIGKNQSDCIQCRMCEQNCEGGCEPAGTFRNSECVLCMNCLNDCTHGLIAYQAQKSRAGEITGPDISRRGVVLSLAGGVLAVPAIRLGGKLSANFSNKLIRPPGSLAEPEFLDRCIKCGQCMRVCPTNVIQPASLEGGLETLWTPILNNRIGSSGCQLNCTACGNICPTGAIRPITLEEKIGFGEFADVGPIKMGTAFVDRNRCLPWAFNRPCLVCEENCPISPKAIYTVEYYRTIRDGVAKIKAVSGKTIEFEQSAFAPEQLASGDYYCTNSSGQRSRILKNRENSVELVDSGFIDNDLVGQMVSIQVHLKGPVVDPQKCIGCGVCEHECPVSGKKAIRVSAEGETRSLDRKLFINRS